MLWCGTCGLFATMSVCWADHTALEGVRVPEFTPQFRARHLQEEEDVDKFSRMSVQSAAATLASWKAADVAAVLASIDGHKASMIIAKLKPALADAVRAQMGTTSAMSASRRWVRQLFYGAIVTIGALVLFVGGVWVVFKKSGEFKLGPFAIRRAGVFFVAQRTCVAPPIRPRLRQDRRSQFRSFRPQAARNEFRSLMLWPTPPSGDYAEVALSMKAEE